MKKTSNIVGIFFIILLCSIAFFVYNTHKKDSKTKPNKEPEFVSERDPFVFSDGLNNPDSVTKYDIDEFDTGIAEKIIYYFDINNDGQKDRITKTFTETGNAHSYYTYKIELKKSEGYIDITPKNFRTTNGASCDLQQIQFSFVPKFKVTIISREMGETWLSPTMAYRQEYTLNSKNVFETTPLQKIRPICDVKELFFVQ
ncbi:MAG: hypothetical protein J6S57_00640 [Alphaproteobacteria bacterium]|nr:hypothetical protein [Alphaproteobacteria bacterium]